MRLLPGLWERKSFLIVKTDIEGFYGRILKRLHSNDGKSRFSFEHVSGTVLQLIIKPGKPLPQVSQKVVVTGELTGAGILCADEVQPDDEPLGVSSRAGPVERRPGFSPAIN